MGKSKPTAEPLSALLLEKELSNLAGQNLTKTGDNVYQLQIEGRPVRLVFKNPTHGAPLERSLAKIATAERRAKRDPTA